MPAQVAGRAGDHSQPLERAREEELLVTAARAFAAAGYAGASLNAVIAEAGWALIELTLAVLQTLDRWAVRHRLHSPGGPAASDASLQILRELIEKR